MVDGEVLAVTMTTISNLAGCRKTILVHKFGFQGGGGAPKHLKKIIRGVEVLGQEELKSEGASGGEFKRPGAA